MPLALDEEDAKDRVSSRRLEAKLMPINLVGKTPKEGFSMRHCIREHRKYDNHTPLIVMAEKYDEDLEDTDINVRDNNYITYP